MNRGLRAFTRTLTNVWRTAPGLTARTLPLRTEAIIAVALIIVGSVLVFATIGRESLWVDEGYSYAISQLPLRDLLTVPFDAHPPGYYLIIRLMRAFGDSELIIRSASGGAAVLASIVFYFLARRLLQPVGALVALAVWINSYTLLVYANDARSYTVLVLLCLTACLLVLEIVERLTSNEQRPVRRSAGLLVGYVLCAILVLYTHAVSMFFLFMLNVVMCCGVLIIKRSAFWRVALTLGTINVVTLLMWAPRLLALQSTTVDFTWLEQASVIDAATTLAVTVGPNGVHPIAVAGYFIAILAGATMLVFRRDWATVTLALTLVGYPGILWAVGLVATPVYMERTALPALAGAALCVGAIAAWLPRRAVAAALAATAIIASAMSSAAYLQRSGSDENYGAHLTQDWRTAVQEMEAQDAVVIVGDPFSFPAAMYYSKQPSLLVQGETAMWPLTFEDWTPLFGAPVQVRAGAPGILMEVQMAERGTLPVSWSDLANRHKRVAFLVTSNFEGEPGDTNDPPDPFLEAGYSLVDTPSFRGISAKIYERYAVLGESTAQ